MIQKKIEFHEAASEEYLAAFLWHLERSEAVADRFSQELSRAIELISRAPQRWPQYSPGLHKFVLRRFPFLVIYREVPSAI